MKIHRNTKLFTGLFTCVVLLLILWANFQTKNVSAESNDDALEKALFTRQEFFGAEASVPLPTAEAQENLAKLAADAPDDPQILEHLAELDEKLQRFDEAAENLAHLGKIDSAKLSKLADFYERRGEFAKEADVLRTMLFSADANLRGSLFERLIELARIHELKNYQGADFYRSVAAENPNVYGIFIKLTDKFIEEKNYTDALALTVQAKVNFPERQEILLEKEVEIVRQKDGAKAAEKIYTENFDPFWSETEAQKFYDFLDGEDRLRAYGAELKARFRLNPADFDAAIRFALYQDHDYSGGNDSVAPIILKMEQAKTSWTTAELVTVSRLLLAQSETDSASRFLYTLYAREDFKQNGELRAKVLYQIFEMFCRAEDQKLPISRGDLRFYEDVAKTDTNPGIATGILSLIFSDTHPGEKLDAQETSATEFFNRAAAFRIFEEYKGENPCSPELAQMSLDLVRIYTDAKEPEIAAKILDDFAADYENSKDYADAALKLADAFAAIEKSEKTREIYQKVLDYLGKNAAGKLQTETIENDAPSKDSTNNSDDSTDRNDDPAIADNDYLGAKKSVVTYQNVLAKLVSSLAAEKKTGVILDVYAAEIAKYPNEQWLYEERLKWLEQTNLVAEQMQTYRDALDRFQTNDWRDKLARFFIRQNRDKEFAEYSGDLIGKLGDAESQKYLSEFVDRKISADQFNRRIYFSLYQSAHRRFPHNAAFVSGLLRYYKLQKDDGEWQKLAAEYYFESNEIRREFLNDLAQKKTLREFSARSANESGTIYALFHADAAARLSDYETAVAAYRNLNQIYPHTPELALRLADFTRSLGQKNREILSESANVSKANADYNYADTALRTRSGEVYAELGDYKTASGEWKKLTDEAGGERENYLDAATVYWDYFQYDDALRTIAKLRAKFADDTLYAYETGAIYEAKYDLRHAVREYVKAAGENPADEDSKTEKAINRLKFLASKDEILPTEIERQTDSKYFNSLPVINAEFSRAVSAKNDYAALGEARFLTKIKQNDRAEKVLSRAVGQSRDQEFIEAALDFCQTETFSNGEQNALGRLSEISTSPRKKIQYALQTAESLQENRQPSAAKITIDNLVRKFPTNLGVLIESSNFYRRAGDENASAAVLQNALPKSRGGFRSQIAARLAARLIDVNRLDAAERILSDLHNENPSDAAVFRELVSVCVRTGNAVLMRKSFAETVSAIKKSDVQDRRELDDEIAGLRVEMIGAFTKLEDYKSAVEQHIEIINREPENEDLTENAVAYVQRYGGAQILLDYYLELSAAAFKNYRWNLVLARIYAANNDTENAVVNYQSAIINQPEMPELYIAVADLETKRGNYDAALENIDEVMTLTNDAPENVKKKIEILQKAGRVSEIAAEKAKLPAQIEEKKTDTDAFAEAEKLRLTESEKAVELYQTAFAALLENPLDKKLETADLTGYAETVRTHKTLDKIAADFLNLREKLIVIADESDGTNAGEARKRLEILDGAITEAIGGTAKYSGTDEELAALHENLQALIGEKDFLLNRHQTVSLVQNLSHRAGFGDLEEMILQKRLAESASGDEKQNALIVLANFYDERGAYQKAFDALENNGSSDLTRKAAAARIVGATGKEIEYLQAIYFRNADKIAAAPDEKTARLLEILHAQNRDALAALTEKSSSHQLQLINFLLGKNERELAHAAIKNSSFSEAWKVSRNAEISLALDEFADADECYFCDALQFDSIGNLLAQTPDKKRFLINDDWFRLTGKYGEWLFAQKDKRFSAAKYLPAMTENLPQDSAQQFKLGEFYLQNNDLKPAVEHLKLAIEIDNYVVEDSQKLATLGAAYWLAGRKDYAENCWSRVTADGGEDQSSPQRIERFRIFAQTLQRHGLLAANRGRFPARIVGFLAENDVDNSEDFQNLIRTLAASFENETEKAAYFQAILLKRPSDESLAKMLLDENLIDGEHDDFCYRRLIEKNNLDGENYEFAAIYERVWKNTDDAESVFANENERDNESDKDENTGERWRRKDLAHLLENGENVQAAQLIVEVEKEMRGKMPRPAWLRTAKFETQIRAGKFDFNEAARFIGITVADADNTIKPPDQEKFGEVRRVLLAENRAEPANDLSEAFFARKIALGETARINFDGLARTYFERKDSVKALEILHLMVKANDETTRETALGEIAALETVKKYAADAKKIEATENDSQNAEDAFEIAANLCEEFGETAQAVEFSRQLFDENPKNADNAVKLGKLLIKSGNANEAAQILQAIENDRQTPRAARWQARRILRETGAETVFPNIAYDSFSQFYFGLDAEKSEQSNAAKEFFINAMLADQTAETTARYELIKIYALGNQPEAALKIVEKDNAAKPDEILEILSQAAEKAFNFQKALEFENAKSERKAVRIKHLQHLADESHIRATNLTVDVENIKK